MRHSRTLIQAVEVAIQGYAPTRHARAIEVLDALRAAEAEEMKADRQALVDTIAHCEDAAFSSLSLADGIADAILADFHVSLRADETVPIRDT